MKRDDVIQLAREACDKTKVDAFYNGYWTITQDELERVIHLATQKAVAEEREAFIDIVAMHGGSIEIEAAIRARSNP